MRLLFAATCPDVFLIEMGKGASGNFLASAAKECLPDLRVLLVEDLPDQETGCFADVVLPQGVEAAVLIERLRILTARKRGPRKRELPPPAWMPIMEGLA
ncbi:hypothetical protein GCM10011507_35120 [Edaphobacter acidisoli]|uniref:Uncharacterized protein n=2 Tax=Edaphobacter acidisoli TaxID=2040573 RepID=A0A916WAS2_9BACT|nr:hypothetical protein GCM10011507_35120 [Edaphobacter acidisoli]